MNKYSKGNDWNLDDESWFTKSIKTGSMILALSIIFGFLFFAFVSGYIVMN